MNQNHFIQRIHQIHQNHQICQNLQIHQNHLICQIQIFILPCPQPFNFLCVHCWVESSLLLSSCILWDSKFWSRLKNLIQILQFYREIWSRSSATIYPEVPHSNQKHLKVPQFPKVPKITSTFNLKVHQNVWSISKNPEISQSTKKYIKVHQSSW